MPMRFMMGFFTNATRTMRACRVLWSQADSQYGVMMGAWGDKNGYIDIKIYNRDDF